MPEHSEIYQKRADKFAKRIGCSESENIRAGIWEVHCESVDSWTAKKTPKSNF